MLLLKVVFEIVKVGPSLSMPAPLPAEFPEIVQFEMVQVPSLSTPPPALAAKLQTLFVIEQLSIVIVPALSRPAPVVSARLFVTTQLLIVNVPLFLTPPPEPVPPPGREARAREGGRAAAFSFLEDG